MLKGLAQQLHLPSANTLFKMPRVQFLYVHRLFDEEVQKFDALLKALSMHHTFISYTEAVDRKVESRIDKPYISISSDDGFKNNLKLAEVLNKYQAKACFFINSDTIGLTDHNKIEAFCNERLDFPPVEFMDWDDVNELLKQGHEIGNHTIGHINVAETSMEAFQQNLEDSHGILESKCGPIAHFAYPFGRYFHFNKDAFELTFALGYESCASAERGCHVAHEPMKRTDLFLRRDHVISAWPLDHIMYFMLNSAKRRDIKNNFTPY